MFDYNTGSLTLENGPKNQRLSNGLLALVPDEHHPVR